MVVDVTPLRTSERFRWLFLVQTGGQISRQLLVVAVPYQVFVLTDSSLLVGLIGIAQFVPLILASLVGGAAADALDRRLVLVGAYAALTVTSLGFAVNAALAQTVWPIFVLIAINAAAMGVGSPTRTAVIPAVVSRTQLPSAFALNQTMHQTMQIVVPALGGVLIAQVGIGAVYWIAAGANLVATASLVPLGPQRSVTPVPRISGAAIRDGWRYLRHEPLLQRLMLIDLNAMVFGMPRALFPVLGLEVLGGGAETVGLLHAAPGIGALAGALTGGWVHLVRRQGRAIVLAVLAWGLAITVLGFVDHVVLALGLLVVAGAADVVSNVFRNAVFQLSVPDGYRGRLTSFKSALSGGGTHLGDAESGAVAAVTTPRFSVGSGGVLTILGAVAIGWWGSRSGLWHATSPDDAGDLSQDANDASTVDTYPRS